MGGVFGSLTNSSPVMEAAGPNPIQLGKANVVDPSTLPQVDQPRPGFLEAAKTGPGGTANALSPQLSTKGKILTGLLSAAAGGLAAAGTRTVGQGLQAGAQLPWEMAQNRLGTQKMELENAATAQTLPFLRAQSIAKLGQTQAETQKARAEAGAIPTKQALERAQAEAANYKDDPNLGLIDLRTKQPVNPAGLAPLFPEEAAVLGKQPGERVPLKLKNTANEIVNRGQTTVNTEEGVFNYNRQTGQKTKLGSNPRNIFAPGNRYVEIADPDNPGQTKFMQVGQAASSGAAGTKSASFQVPKDVLKWATTGEGGKMAGAFNTAMQHADLLEQAARALNNGDQQTLNSLKNRFKNEFGSTGPVNARAIADAYTREVTKMLSGGHLTDSEIGTIGATLDPSRQSLDQVLGVIGAYKSLAGSKMNILYNQFQKGMQGQPNFGPSAQQGGGDFFSQFGGRARQ